MNLAEALLKIAANCYVIPEMIGMIQFEDGSGYRFNFAFTNGVCHYAEFSQYDKCIIRNTFREVQFN